jgi:hypothetical protein
LVQRFFGNASTAFQSSSNDRFGVSTTACRCGEPLSFYWLPIPESIASARSEVLQLLISFLFPARLPMMKKRRRGGGSNTQEKRRQRVPANLTKL